MHLRKIALATIYIECTGACWGQAKSQEAIAKTQEGTRGAIMMVAAGILRATAGTGIKMEPTELSSCGSKARVTDDPTFPCALGERIVKRGYEKRCKFRGRRQHAVLSVPSLGQPRSDRTRIWKRGDAPGGA